MKPLEDMGKHATVVIDPPWALPWATAGDRGNGYGSTPYQVMSLERIALLPVGRTLQDDSTVFCWTTNTMLPSTFPLLYQWNVSYWFTMVWAKEGGPQGRGLPAYNGELIVVGRRGKPRFLDTKQFRTVNYWKRGAHSKKPEEFYDLLRRVTPGPRLDIFGRRHIPGFDSWGDQAPETMKSSPYYQDVLF